MSPTPETRTTPQALHLDGESCYRAVKSRDRRFDGVFYTAVRTTGIYCRRRSARARWESAPFRP